MGKISKAILMLDYLNTGNKYTAKELAEKLEITERMVRYYKEELEKSGIIIESFKGPNGGYFVLNARNSYNKFNKYDIELLETALKELEKQQFQFLDKFSELVDKVKKISSIKEEESKLVYDYDEKNENEKNKILNDCIQGKNTIEILYQNLDGTWQKRKIHPIQIFKFKNKLFITAFCELRNDIRHFEISRIKICK